tara:strand:+ start:22856 stop:24487 length:1632 start_codon:yes stop_codon:yes gene_type:complete
MSEQTLADRYRLLNSKRQRKLDHAREASKLTIPSILPPESHGEEDSLYTPYSSIPARGVTAMSSKMLSALIPLNEDPFFKFAIKDGVTPSPQVNNYLEALADQVYTKLKSKNLREVVFLALQHLIIAGDVLFVLEDDMSCRLIRLDNYVVRRDVVGNVKEVIFVEYELKEEDDKDLDMYTSFQAGSYAENKHGYDAIFVQCIYDEKDEMWKVTKEKDEEVIETGEFSILPYIPLRWGYSVGDNYGRSHCEDILGDITALEAYSEALIESMAAGSAFWIAVDPAGITDIDDIAAAPNGTYVAARAQDVFTLTPSGTMNAQIQSTNQAVEIMRREIGRSFLLESAAMPTGDRVTATAVRMIGTELETVLGGAFGSISRDLFVPLVNRAVYVMISDETIDERLYEEFLDDGLLSVDIVTGLQALSRDTDLNKLMQLGEMVRNLPEQVAMMFRWDEYGKALVTALGFDADNWVKNESEVKEEMMKQQQAMTAQQMQGQLAGVAGEQIAGAVGQQAAGAVQGQGIEGLLQGLDPQAAQALQETFTGSQ